MVLPGTGIALYGLTDLNSSPFTVFIDGITQQTLTPNSQIASSANGSQLLFVRNDLVQGDHTLVVRNNPPASGGFAALLSIERMEVYATSLDANTPRYAFCSDAALVTHIPLAILHRQYGQYCISGKFHDLHNVLDTPTS